jgi:hypothetical protein
MNIASPLQGASISRLEAIRQLPHNSLITLTTGPWVVLDPRLWFAPADGPYQVIVPLMKRVSHLRLRMGMAKARR